ncbi:hypothetical protein LTR62_005160 [Meristemomyces frigidus]|uniref:Spindle pole body component n=1 Tax=Meristemomyces frigidus TaxID=1508187 RepID=A0AAN7TLA3_9PEZI|nr:hypothetical protein LTR62_005160 [Meristemomyces frigidus]
MAHATAISELAECLFVSIKGTSRDDPAFRGHKEQTIEGLRDSGHARTNQFEVKERLEGLVEKFGVLNRDDLADALQLRLNELPTNSLYLPELLSLLLELSNGPFERNEYEPSEKLLQGNVVEDEPTWQDILDDDPLSEDGIWDDVKGGYHSSGDEAARDGDDYSDPTASTSATSFDEDDLNATARQHFVQPDLQLLEDIRLHQGDLRGANNSHALATFSELAVIREVITMLQGLPSCIFTTHEASGKVRYRGNCSIFTAQQSTLRHLLELLASCGTHLGFLRYWTQQKNEVAKFLQSMQSAVYGLLSILTIDLGSLAQRYISPMSEQVVSIAQCHAEIEDLTRPLVRLSEVIQNGTVLDAPILSRFGVIDALYDEACLAHRIGDQQIFITVLKPLLAGLQTYSRLVQHWVSTGGLPEGSQEYFFVRDENQDCVPSDVWHNRFVTNRTAEGQINAPQCVHPLLQRAFDTGKSRAFLVLLGDVDSALPPMNLTVSTVLESSTFEHLLSEDSLQSFDQLLLETLDTCLTAQAADSTLALLNAVLHDHGLLSTLKAIEFLYFSKDGGILQSFTETLFGRIDRRSKTWADPFMLTELAENTFGASSNVDMHLITVRTDSKKAPAASASEIKQLEHLEVGYALSWPVQNITRTNKLTIHAATFAFLLQVEYCSHLLHPQIFVLRRLPLQNPGQKLQATLRYALGLRNRLLWYLGVLRAHITMTCSLLHRQVTQQMNQADGIDAMASAWQDYETKLQTSLLLTRKLSPIRNAVIGILELCERCAPKLDFVLQDSSLYVNFTATVDEMDKALSFVVAGLRAVSRAGGEASLATLAENLDWKG